MNADGTQGDPMPKPDRRKREVDEKREGLRHVGYELKMCAVAPLLWAEAPDQGRRNAAIECSIMHARALVEMLLRKEAAAPGPDDMLRSDYCAEEFAAPSSASGYLNGLWQRMNRRMSHLSWERTESDVSWDLPRIARECVSVVEAWAAHVTTEEPDLAGAMDQHLAESRKYIQASSDGAEGPTAPMPSTAI